MLTVHHLGKSQSERIVWLCEELGLPYELKRYERDPVTILAPPELRTLHPIGAGLRNGAGCERTHVRAACRGSPPNHQEPP